MTGQVPLVRQVRVGNVLRVLPGDRVLRVIVLEPAVRVADLPTAEITNSRAWLMSPMDLEGVWTGL